MNYYAHIGTNGKVYGISESATQIVQIPSADQRLLGCVHNVTGEFEGYKIQLSVDKPYIIADNVDTTRITATITTWDDQDAGDDYSAPILFVVDGTPQLINKKIEGYYIDFKTATTGSMLITTQDTNFILQGSVSVLAVESESI